MRICLMNIVSVLQDKKSSGDLYNRVNIHNTTEMYIENSMINFILCVFYSI